MTTLPAFEQIVAWYPRFTTVVCLQVKSASQQTTTEQFNDMSVVQTAWQFIFHNSTPLGAPKPICSQGCSTSLLKDLRLFLNQAAATNGHAMYLHSTSFRNLSKFKKGINMYQFANMVLETFIDNTSWYLFFTCLLGSSELEWRSNRPLADFAVLSDVLCPRF